MNAGLTTFISNSNKKGRHDTIAGLAYYAQKSMAERVSYYTRQIEALQKQWKELAIQCRFEQEKPEDKRNNHKIHLIKADLKILEARGRAFVLAREKALLV